MKTEHSMDHLFLAAQKYLLAIFVFMSGVFAAVLEYTVRQQAENTIVSYILGPLGALAFAIAVIGYLVRYMKRQEARLNKLQDQFLEETRKEAEYWRREAMEQKRKSGKA